MKRKYIGFLLNIFIAILLTACSHENKPNQPVKLPEYAFIDNIFLIGDNIYATRSAGNSEGGYSYLSTELSDKQVSYPLASLRNGEENDALWHDSTKRLYYSEAHRVYSCDSTGNEKEILWELPEGSKNDAVEIIASAKEYLILKTAHGDRKPASQSLFGNFVYREYDYYSVNIVTGEALLLLSDIPYTRLPHPLCVHENTMIFLQLTGKEGYASPQENEMGTPEEACVMKIDLLTGKKTELGFMNTSGTISHAEGAVLEDRLYFIFEYGGFYSLPLSGGDMEAIYPDKSNVPEMDRYERIKAYNGKIFLLMWAGNTYPKAALCEWNRETGVLLPIVTTDSTFSATGFLIHSDSYYLYDEVKVVSGELKSK